MTTVGSTLEPAADAKKPPWYRRRPVLVVAGAVVVIGLTVFSDLPQPEPISRQVSDEMAVISEINADAATCVFAIKETFSIYADETKGTLSPSDKATVPTLLRDDQGACSYTNSSIYDLSNIEIPTTAAGREIGDVLNTVTVWATEYALGAIVAIETLSNDLSDSTSLASLASNERGLASQRSLARSQVNQADHLLRGAHLPYPIMPVTPAPPRNS